MLRNENIERVDGEAMQTVDITDFVELGDVTGFLSQALLHGTEPQKGGDKANALLREALKKSSKIGIAKVVSKRRHISRP